MSELIHSSALDMARALDRIRAGALHFGLQNRTLRAIYCDRASRLSFNFCVLFAVYFFLSLKLSPLLLVLGPVFLGYPHLIASYRFLQMPSEGLSLRWGSVKIFRFFLLLTALSLAIRFGNYAGANLPRLTFGAYEILLSLSLLALIRVPNVLVSLVAAALIALVLKLAWMDPLAFVGIALILHNWVAFGHWFFAAKDWKNRAVVIFATALFVLAHALVLGGIFDSSISFPELEFLSTRSFEVKGWALASWSNDPAVWSRFIVLYAFGLSVHYFVWLRAIPQCLDEKAVPNSFRLSWKKLLADCGPKLTVTLFLGGLGIIGLWIFTSYAGPFYFGLALLHGWLELTFLVVAVCARAWSALGRRPAGIR